MSTDEQLDTPTTARSLTDEEWRDGLERIAAGYTSIDVELAKAIEDKGLVSIAFEGDGRAAVNLTDDGEACLDHARETWEGLDSTETVCLAWRPELALRPEPIVRLIRLGLVDEKGATPFGRACLRAGEACLEDTND